MEITRENFAAVFPKVQYLLQTCDFYAFDLEMSGINPVRTEEYKQEEAARFASLPNGCRFYSTPEDSFAGKWKAASTFSPMQLGLSIFHKRSAANTIQQFRQKLTCQESGKILDDWSASGRNNAETRKATAAMRSQLSAAVEAFDATNIASPDTLESISRLHLLLQELDLVEEFVDGHREAGVDSYVAATFHCYLFPSFHYGDGELKMSVETTGRFLADHNMDFNGWVKKGLLFAPRETLAMKRLEALKRAANGKSATGRKGFDQELLAKVPKSDMDKVTTLFARMEKFAEENSDNKEAVAPKAAPFLSDQGSFAAVQAKAKSLGLRLMSGDLMWEATASAAAGDGSEKHQANLLFEAMLNSKKPAVAHNCWSDLLFLYRAFHSTDLRSYAHFKEVMRVLFPVLFDTRTLSALDINQSLGQVRGQLDRTYQSFRRRYEASDVRVTMTDGFAEGSAVAHNAGYDAFTTGALFVYATTALKVTNSPLRPESFNGVVPVYASVFSISLHTEHDYLVQAPNAPILYAIPGTMGGGQLTDRVGSALKQQNLSCVPFNCGDIVLCFVTGTAPGTGNLLATNLKKAREAVKAFGNAQLFDMEIQTFVEATNGKIRYFAQ